jgi:MoaA/NifB/PqqE/SkfB family radical SAM enzyme
MWNDTLNFISKLNVPKLINMLKAEMSYRLSSVIRRTIVWGMPYSYSIETSSICNLACPECPTGKGITHRNNNTMPMEQYQTLISQIKPAATYLMLYLQGEPFLNPHIFEMIQLAGENKIYSCISTNGHFLDKQSALNTVTSGLNRIIISFDGVTNEVYQQYRRGGSLEKVLEGITNLVDAKRSLKSQKPFIILQFIVFKHNQHQISEFKILSHSLGVNKAEVKTAQLYDFEHGHPMMTDLDPFSRYRKSGYHFVLKKSIRNTCKRIWTTGVLTSDGIMVPCCYDKAARYAMGKADDENLEILWKGQLFNRYRREILAHRMKIDICCNCDE